MLSPELALSLFLFNVGIEVGQLMVIAVMLSIAWVARRTGAFHAPLWQQAFTACMGIAAAYWTIDRTWAVF